MYEFNPELPELANLSANQRQQIWQICYRKYAFKHWQTWVSLLVLSMLIGLGGHRAGAVGGALGGGLGGAIFGLTISSVLRPHYQDSLEEALSQMKK